MKSILSILILALVALATYASILNWQLAETQRLAETANAQAEVALRVGQNSFKNFFTGNKN